MSVIAGKDAAFYIAASVAVVFTDEATTATNVRKTWTINDTTKRYWDDTDAPLIETRMPDYQIVTRTGVSGSIQFAYDGEDLLEAGWDSSPADLQTGLQFGFAASSHPEFATVTVAGTAGGPWYVHFPSTPPMLMVVTQASGTVVPSISSGETWVTASPDTIQYVGGKAIFTVSRPVGTVLRVTGSYFPITEVVQAKAWGLDVGFELVDSTYFGQEWRTFESVVGGGSGSVSQWYLNSDFFERLGDKLVAIFYTNSSTSERYEGFAHLDKDGIKAAVEGLVEEDLGVTIDGELFYSSS